LNGSHLDGFRHREDRAVAGRQWRGLALLVAVDADHDLLGVSMAERRPRIGLHERTLEIARLHARHRAAEGIEVGKFAPHLVLDVGDALLDDARAVEDILVIEEIGLEGEDLLHAQRPLLIPRARQAERLVPGRKLHRAGAGLLGERHGQHLDEDAVHVVLGLLLGEPERVHLHPVAEHALLRVRDAVAVPRDLVPEFAKARSLQISVMKRMPALTKNEMRPDDVENVASSTPAARTVSRTATAVPSAKTLPAPPSLRLLQVVGAHIHGVPLRHLGRREQDHVFRELQRGRGGNT
jgi:hypothetical protein